jgi:hypothetical protein
MHEAFLMEIYKRLNDLVQNWSNQNLVFNPVWEFLSQISS